MGMVGGGVNGFIGRVHLSAALLDNEIELVSGCFSSRAEVSLESGRLYHLPADRIYGSYEEMMVKESLLPASERMDFVSIVTPNRYHYAPAMLALGAGFSVMLDKPLTYSLEEARLLKHGVDESGLLLGLTHVYSGYPAVKEMRFRIAAGELGELRRLYVEYPQGWLSDRIELLGGNNAGWRTDPALTGKGGCVGDIGTHAWHLSEYVTGQRVTELCSELSTFVSGRLVDDDAVALLHYDGGLKGVLTASQIAIGEANAITLRIYGTRGAFEWHQMDPNRLIIKHGNRPEEVLHVGNNTYLGSTAGHNVRTPAGHPEGFIEAFANIYRNFALTLRARLSGETPTAAMLDFPDVNDGLRGMQFIETMVAGSGSASKWQPWIE
jgi:predicted dehydrogenase